MPEATEQLNAAGAPAPTIPLGLHQAITAPDDATLLAAIVEHERIAGHLKSAFYNTETSAPRQLLRECCRQLEVIIATPATTLAGHAARARFYLVGAREDQAEIAGDRDRDLDQRVLAALLRDLSQGTRA